MNTEFENLFLITQLSQADTSKTFYGDLLESNDVNDLYNNIALNYSLSEFQEDALLNLFDIFDDIRINIDPNRLKPFEHFMNGDNELLLFRKTDQGLVNIIIHSEECIAFSFIPKNEGTRRLYFLDQEQDFERLAYDFFTY